jgi:hypothetical protein
MAGEVPKEPKEGAATPSDIPGGFPATPADELDKTVSVNPLPAADFGLNPIKLAPGEKVPDVSAADVNQHVKLDKESYEKSDAIPGIPDLPPATGAAVIPESGLPITTAAEAATINSVGPGATTATLAGDVPKEPKVPAVVTESQQTAHVEPEASAIPEEVKEKAQVEEELKEKVPEAPSTSEGTAGVGTEKKEGTGAATAAVATTGGAVAATALAAKDSAVETATPILNQATAAAIDAANRGLPDSVKEQLPTQAQEALREQNQEAKREEVSPEVPAEVKQSITEAGESPEAAANTTAVEEKKAVESELLKEVKAVPAEGETKTVEAPKDAATTPAPGVTSVTESKAAAPAPAAANSSESKAAALAPAVANGSESKPATPAEASGSKTADASTTEKKKKNRLSTVLSKIKHKLSDKN